MPNISPVIVHKPDGYHGWGIEFNKERHFWEADATAFVDTMYREMLHRDHNFTWFHQCGSNQEKNGRYYDWTMNTSIDPELGEPITYTAQVFDI